MIERRKDAFLIELNELESAIIDATVEEPMIESYWDREDLMEVTAEAIEDMEDSLTVYKDAGHTWDAADIPGETATKVLMEFNNLLSKLPEHSIVQLFINS